MEDGASVIPSEAGPDNVQDEVLVAKPRKKERRKRPERAYAPTPKQLEALAKARKSKQAKRKKVTFDLPQAKEAEPEEPEEPLLAKHVAEEPDSPVEVVRDNKLLKDFATSADIVVAPTGLGRKRRRPQPEASENGTWDNSSLGSSLSLAAGKVALVAAGVVATTAVVGGVYFASKRLRSSTSEASQPEPARAATGWWSGPAAPERGPRVEARPSNEQIIDKAPWER